VSLITLTRLKQTASKNKVFKSFIGKGYYDVIVPGVIQRNILENPGWYTQYTPYQAEIAQGRLQALLNFQTMVIDLTGMEIANASLLDEGTAAAEAMFMQYSLRKNNSANVFFVSEELFPQTIDILKTRSEPYGIELRIGDHRTVELTDDMFGAIVQYPAGNGAVYNYADFAAKGHEKGIKLNRCCRYHEPCPVNASGRMGSRHCCWFITTFWRTDGLWWPSCRFLCY
jgi:glycine dehydrogenase